MPLIAPAIAAKLKVEIMSEMLKAFGPSPAPDSLTKMAEAVANAVAKVIVMELTTSAQVAPGIPTAGSPAAQASVGPGKIL